MSLAYLRARYPHIEAMLKVSEAIFEPPHNSNAANAMNAAEAIAALENLNTSTNAVNANPQPLAHMTYQSLTEALARLADDPRIHPNTKIELEYQYEIQHYGSDEYRTVGVVATTEPITEREPLVSISIHPGTVRLSSARAEPAAAR